MEAIQTLLTLLALHGGRIVNTADLSPEQINQARASGRMYVSEDALGYVWEPNIKGIPQTEEEVAWFEQWYPLPVELPEHLKDPSFLFNQGEAPERTASQQAPDQGDAAGLQITSLQAEVEQLRSWKAQALACTPDWQAIGKALDLPLGTSVSDQVLPGILNLLKEKHELVIALRRQQAYCLRYVRAYATTSRYREVETLLDKHHHSTETI